MPAINVKDLFSTDRGATIVDGPGMWELVQTNFLSTKRPVGLTFTSKNPKERPVRFETKLRGLLHLDFHSEADTTQNWVFVSQGFDYDYGSGSQHLANAWFRGFYSPFSRHGRRIYLLSEQEISTMKLWLDMEI